MPNAKPKWKVHKAEANLDEAMRAYLGKGPESYSPWHWTCLCNQLKLQALFPGQWVLWRDHHEGEGKDCRLVWREILCVAPDSKVIDRKFKRLSVEEKYGVFLAYIEPEDAILRIP